jgi:MAF protein
MNLILASGSPRRQQLIQLLGLPWRVMVADVDEDSIDHPDPAVNVIQTAQLKAEAVLPLVPEKAIVLAVDTTVALDGQMLNKPTDENEARAMLQRLRGRTHQVHTGLVIINKATGQLITDVASVNVPMRHYTDEEIEAYIATGDPLDKAGAYAIQHPDFRPVSQLQDCYAAVVGLPLCHLVRSLRKIGVDVPVDIAHHCQVYHQYDCPVFERILAKDPS